MICSAFAFSSIKNFQKSAFVVLFSCFCPKNHETLGKKQIHNIKKKGSFMKKDCMFLSKGQKHHLVAQLVLLKNEKCYFSYL